MIMPLPNFFTVTSAVSVNDRLRMLGALPSGMPVSSPE
jgi:hypothetical protein